LFEIGHGTSKVLIGKAFGDEAHRDVHREANLAEVVFLDDDVRRRGGSQSGDRRRHLRFFGHTPAQNMNYWVHSTKIVRT